MLKIVALGFCSSTLFIAYSHLTVLQILSMRESSVGQIGSLHGIEIWLYQRLKTHDWWGMYKSPVCVLLRFMLWLIVACALQYPALAAGGSSACDVLIMVTIAYFLRTQSQMRRCGRYRSFIMGMVYSHLRQENYIHQLKAIFIGMGLMTWWVQQLIVDSICWFLVALSLC